MKRKLLLNCSVAAGVMLALATTLALCSDRDTLSLTVLSDGEIGTGSMSWEALGPPGGSVPQIVYHPTVSGLVYLERGGLWISLNGGRRWYPIPGINDIRGRILIDPFRPNVLLVGTSDSWYEHYLKRSSDYGLTWETVLEVCVDGDVFDPTQPGLVYMCTPGLPDMNQTAHFYRSTDHGRTWTVMCTAGSGDGRGFIYYWSILRPSPIDGSIMARTGWSDGIGGTWVRVCRSTDQGATWLYDDTGLPDFGYTTTDMEYVFPNVLAACTVEGFYVHLHGGDRWHPVPNEMSGRYTVGLSPGPAENVWYLVEGFTGGEVVHRSTDWGVTWSALPMMDGDFDIGPVSADPHAEPGTETIMVGAGIAGVFATTDFGQHWEQRVDGLPAIHTASLAFGPVGSSLLYAGTGVESGAGLYRSRDLGRSWELTITGFPRGEVPSICAHPTDENIVYAARGEVFRSTDQGDTWTQVTSGFTNTWCIAINPENPNIVFAGTQYHGLYKSTDGGDSWFFSGEGMPGVSVRDIAMDPLDPLHMFAANAGAGVCESTNGGESWNAVLEVGGSRFVSVAVAAGGDHVYAGENRPTYHEYLYRSTDGGDTWEIILSDVVANDIVVPADEPLAVAFGGDYNTGAWGSFDGGDTWFQLLSNQGTFYVNQLAIPPAGAEGFLYAAMKSGIQRYSSVK